MTENLFNSEDLNKLNDPVRFNWLPPALIWEALALENPRLLIDYGAGSGVFTRAIGQFAQEAVIHAVDIQEKMIAALQSSMPESIRPCLIHKTELPFENDAADGLWSIAVYHEIDDKERFLSEAFRVLKPGGVLLLIDWEKENPRLPKGPPLRVRTAVTDLISQMSRQGFREITSTQGFNSHICLRGVKPQSF
ncbi:MAG: class I SAM-dependent methyltransferase [Spirochaetales bacterium]|nr:class I SAM-dependent methyltransferase [Spirochaetales bacterium]